MRKEILVHVIRPVAIRGVRAEPGSTLSLCPLDAAALVTNGKATLHNVADEAALSAAVLEDFRRASGGGLGNFARAPWGMA